MTHTHLKTAKTALEEYLDSSECGVCKAYAENIHTAIEELTGMHERGAEFVQYTKECIMLKRLIGEENGKQQTDDR